MAALALDTLDITDTRLYVSRGYPWAEWDLLRREAPVFWYQRPGMEPFWVITRHADIQTLSRRSDVFVNSGRLRLATSDEDDRMWRSFERTARQRGWDPHEEPDLVFMDDPKHKSLRLLTSRAFTPAHLRTLEPKLDALSRRFVAEFCEAVQRQTREAGACDFVREFAVKLPLATIGEMMGLPPDDWMQILVWTNALIADVQPSFQRPGESLRGAMRRAVEALREYFQAHMDARRAAGASGDDLTDVLLRAELGGKPLTEQQLHGYLVLLTAAGNETTRNATTGGVQALLEHPDQRDLLCAHPELVDSAVEEILRWTSPVVQFARTATRDFELRGQKIRAGESVGMFYPSANRDEDVFDEPYRFDITRKPNHHLAFGGYGAHFCLGANLARWELRAAFRALLPVLPRLELAGEPERIPHLHVPGYKTLPVRWTEPH